MQIAAGSGDSPSATIRATWSRHIPGLEWALKILRFTKSPSIVSRSTNGCNRRRPAATRAINECGGLPRLGHSPTPAELAQLGGGPTILDCGSDGAFARRQETFVLGAEFTKTASHLDCATLEQTEGTTNGW